MVSSFLNNYFGFNKQQRSGLLVLAVISFVLLVIRIIYPYFITPANISIQSLPLVERKVDSAYTNSQNQFSTNFSDTKTQLNLFVFDPNTISFNQLLQLGFKEKTAKTFLKFRERGFVFKEKKDLQKVYGISDATYKQLEPYILIETKNKNEPTHFTENKNVIPATLSKNQATKVVELNSADSLILLDIKGIGPSFAKRILKYRSLLGGYVNIEQLKEVYGFTDELYEKVKSNFTVNTSSIKKIDLNKDDFKTINKHPYLSYELTKSIFDWRKKTVITTTNLKDIINDAAVYNKLLPYLIFD